MKTMFLSSFIGVCVLLGGITAKGNELPSSADGEKKAAKSLPFRGKIAEVDKSAKTIKVGVRTFQVVAATKIIKAGKPAILDDATVGEEVGGAYREADGGSLELVSLRLGAKADKEAAPKKEKKE